MRIQFIAPGLLLIATTVRSDVFSYESTSFPEDAGWEVVSQFCDPETWLLDGWYFQLVAPGCGGPPGGDQDEYTRSIEEYEGTPEFFIEWRVSTDGDASEINGSAPAVLAAGGHGAVLYHFTIARDQVRFLRDTLLPILWIDIEPGIPHTYRLELYGEELYVWYIDGQVVDAGVPEGAYPSSTPSISWRAKSWYLPSTTRWDYIRYGTIPQPGSGDFDSDGDVDLTDYYFFHDCLTGPLSTDNAEPATGEPQLDTGSGSAGASFPGCTWADFDADRDVDFHDFGAFQAAFTGPDG